MQNISSDLSPDTLLDKGNLCQAIATLKGKKVLILGDVMLDVYLQGQAKRISPEAPVPVVHVHTQKHLPGGAANVACNIRSLGGLPTLIGLCGAGADGQNLVRLLQESYIATHIFQDAARCTTVKTRIMAQNQQMLRVDKEEYLPSSAQETVHLCHVLESLLPMHDVLILSDYAKGLITDSISQHIQDICAEHALSPEIFVDPKPKNAAIYGPTSLMTPNRNEATAMAHMPIESREDVLVAGQRIMENYHCRQLLMTLGSEGMALFLADGHVWNIAPHARAVFDVTGAGDTVIASLALARAAKIPLLQACIIATYAAGLVLEHVGVACVSIEDVLASVHNSLPLSCTLWK